MTVSMPRTLRRTSRSRRGLGRRVLALASALGPLVGSGLGCSGDHLTRAQPVAPDSLFWALELNHHAVTLSLQAPYDTLTLGATPRTSQGAPLPSLADLGTPQYKSTNLDQVLVTDGVLHAVALTTPGQPVPVVATLSAQGVTHVDTVLVRVVADTLPKLASVSIHPLPPDSAKTGAIVRGSPVFYGSPLLVRATDSTGAPIEDPLVAIRLPDTLTAWLWNFSIGPRRWVYGRRLGSVTMVASATMFGVTKADTLPYQVGWPVFTTINFQRVVTAAGDTVVRFDTPEMRVGKGAVIQWRGLSDSADVTFAEGDLPNILPADLSRASFLWASDPYTYAVFDGSAAAFRDAVCSGALFDGVPSDCDSGGNVVLTPERPIAYRVFSTPGTYEYHSTRFGGSSRIIVVDE